MSVRPAKWGQEALILMFLRRRSRLHASKPPPLDRVDRDIERGRKARNNVANSNHGHIRDSSTLKGGTCVN